MSDKAQEFVQIMTSWLVSLPHDLKLLLDAKDDENLSREARLLAVGGLVYVVSPNDFISADRPDSVLSYCDDALLLHMVLAKLGASDDEDTEFFKSRNPEFFEGLADELAACEAAVGDELYGWLNSKVALLTALEYKGKKVPAFLDDDEAGEYLYEDVLGFRTEYEVDEETIGDKFKKASGLIELWKRKKEEEDRKNA